MELWKAVKGLKRKYVPRYIQMRNKEGKHVAPEDKAEAIADYLEKEHLHNEEMEEGPSRAKISENANIVTDNFTLGELNKVLKSCKNNKQPGPDKVIMELIKWLNQDNKQIIPDLINEWWKEEKAP